MSTEVVGSVIVRVRMRIKPSEKSFRLNTEISDSSWYNLFFHIHRKISEQVCVKMCFIRKVKACFMGVTDGAGCH